MTRLILTERGTYLGKTSEQFRIRVPNEKDVLRPAKKVDQIIVLGRGISVSADAIQLANENNVDMLFLSYYGKPIARIIPAKLGGTVKTRREQYLAYYDERSVALAKWFVIGKLRNESSLLKSFAKKWKGNKDELWQDFRMNADKIIDIANSLGDIKGKNIDQVRDAIMGIEGRGTNVYWQTFMKLITEEWGFKEREYPNAKDPINALLNFGYYLLEQEVWKCLLYAGLDPYAGFLHADRAGQQKLIYDVMEEFRPIAVDRVVVNLSNRMKLTHFIEKERIEMTRDGMKMASKEFLERFDQTIEYKGQKQLIKNIIRKQCVNIVTYLRGERPAYEPFTPRW